jgi:hypothetical protein
MAARVLVTGCEKNYFVMTLMLLHTLKRWAPAFPVYVLDFGMTEPQKAFLGKRATVLALPPEVPAGEHSLFYKTAMGNYLRGVDWSAMAWIDCDMVALGPVGERIDALIDRMERDGSEIAACLDDSGTVARLLATGMYFQPFADAMQAEGTDFSAPLYNAGLFVCRSHAFMEAWWERGKTVAMHVVFDQSIFNLLIQKRGAPVLLSAREWNLHGSALNAATVAADASGRPTLLIGNEKPLLLHPTSPRAADVFMAGDLKVGGQALPGYLKFCVNPAVQRLQQMLLNEFLTENFAELRASGVMG